MRVVLVKGVLRHARVLVSLLPKKVSKQLSIGQFLSICYQKQYQKSSQLPIEYFSTIGDEHFFDVDLFWFYPAIRTGFQAGTLRCTSVRDSSAFFLVGLPRRVLAPVFSAGRTLGSSASFQSTEG